MTSRSQVGTMGQVRRQLERWRGNRKKGARIPEPIWQAAVEVAREHGLWQTAKELRLDYYSLQDRVASSNGDTGEFIEIPLPATAMRPDCVVEIEDGRGARMRVELQGKSADSVESVVRALWSA